LADFSEIPARYISTENNVKKIIDEQKKYKLEIYLKTEE
jgi:hypothetical protein